MSGEGQQDSIPGGTPGQAENDNIRQQAVAERLAQDAAENVGKATEEHERRDLVDASGNVSRDARAEEDLALLAGPAVPDIDRNAREAIISSFRKVDEKIDGKPAEGQLQTADISFIAQELASLGFKKDDSNGGTTNSVDAYLSRKNLTPEEKEAIKNQLPEKDANSDDHNLSDREAAVKGGVAERLRDVADRDKDRALEKIDRSHLSEEEKLSWREKVEGLYTRMTDMFAPGEPGRDWARRIGKTLYWSMIIAFIFLIWEMNMINKAAGKR